MGKQENLYKLIDQQCNAGPIADLLRKYKDTNKETKKEILVSGNKPDLIKNLRNAVTHEMIPLDDAIDLLRESEENGQQHIFYFRPVRKAVSQLCKDFDRIIEAIFGVEWNENYPLFDFIPDEYQWVDLRKGICGKRNDWVLKVYGQERHFEQTKVEQTKNSRIEYYHAEEIRVVCLVRWNSPDLLEIRIDSQRLNSRKARRERLAKMWELLSPAFLKTDFTPWHLESARSHMAANRGGNVHFELGDLRLLDSEGGSALFKTNSDEESVDDLASRGNAIDALVNDEETSCDTVRVHWKIPDLKKADEPLILKTDCGGMYTNELSIRARTSARAIDHVTNRLREFNN